MNPRPHADQRVRRVATGSAPLPEVRFVFGLDADSENQAMDRAAAVVVAAVTGSHFEPAQWTYRVRSSDNVQRPVTDWSDLTMRTSNPSS